MPEKPWPKTGLIDLNGREVLPCEYDSLHAPQCGLMACRRNAEDKFGYLNLKGTFAITPQFEEVNDFDPVSELARVRNECDGVDCYGLIDLTGRPVIPIQYGHVGLPSEGLTAFELHEQPNLHGFLDVTGNVVIPPRFSEVTPFCCGLACVSFPDAPEDYYFVDRAGRKVLGPYVKSSLGDVMDPFDPSGIALVTDPQTHQHRCIDVTGKTVLAAPRGVRFQSFKNGLIDAYESMVEKWGIMDLSGKWVVKPRYEDIGRIVDGYCVVTDHDGINIDEPSKYVNRRQGLIDVSERVIAPLGKWWFGLLSKVSNGRIPFREETKEGPLWGYLSLPNGEVAIPPRYRAAGGFSEGFATVSIA